MKNYILFLFLNLIFLSYLRAQTFQLFNAEEYFNTCNESLEFRKDKDILEKKDDILIVKAKKGKIKFEDYLVEQEDPEMKLYRAVGVNNQFCLALIEEIGLVSSEFILINLKNKKIFRFNARPFISSDGNYVVSVSQPEGDEYDGLEIHKLERGDYELIFKNNNKTYYYLENSSKWCENNFFIKRVDLLNFSDEKFYRVEF